MDDGLSEAALNTERLLSAIERLRGERDGLRRDLEFVQIENKFAVETLQKQLAAVQAQPHPLKDSQTTIVHNDTPSIPMPLFERCQRAAVVSALVVQHLHSQCEAQETYADTLVEASRRQQEQLQQSQQGAKGKEDLIRSLQRDNTSLQEQLSIVEMRLSKAEGRAGDLMSRVESLEEDLAKERESHEETGVALSRTEAELMDLNRTLADAESERDSHALRITHLEQDLEKAQDELQDAEERYKELQSQQLASMSSSEATRALRKQIEELEGRVMRRTEQIGVHQHDIKRLETNLRLQEDRIAEMTGELNLAETEKEAMVEDCRSTREERDEARLKCEELEDALETMEEKLVEMTQQRDTEIQALVEVIMRSVSIRKASSQNLSSSLSQHLEQHSQLQSQIHEADTFKQHALEQINQLKEQHKSALQLVEEKASLVESLQSAKDQALEDARLAKEALQTAQVNSHDTSGRLTALRDENESLYTEIARLRGEVQAKAEELFSLKEQHESLELRDVERRARERAEFEERVAVLEKQYGDLEDSKRQLDRRYAETLEQLERTTEELKSHTSTGAESAAAEKALRNELDNLRHQSNEEKQRLQTELSDVRAELEAIKQNHSELEASYQKSAGQIAQSKSKLEAQLQEVTNELLAVKKQCSGLEDLKSQRDIEIRELEESLESLSNELDATVKAREEVDAERKAQLHRYNELQAQLVNLQSQSDAKMKELQIRVDQLSQDLEQTTKARDDAERLHETELTELKKQYDEASASLKAKENLEQELEKLRQEHTQHVEELQSRLEAAQNQHQGFDEVRQEFEARYERVVQELNDTKASSEERVAQLTDDISALQTQLETLIDERDRLHAEKAAMMQQSKRVEQEQLDLRDELETVRRQLHATDEALQALQSEKEELQQMMTAIEAEAQRSLSVQRYQESQLKDHDREVNVLKEQLERTKADYLRSEQAEIKLAMQAAQHEKTISNLRRDLDKLRQSPKLEETVAELSERNAEMEQLLRAKCLEIEENDDRFIEMLKEKKKLTSKIESLTKKVNHLQTKLQAAKEAKAEASSSQLKTSPPPPAPSLSVPPAVPRVPTVLPTPITPISSARAASPSSAGLQRARTPESSAPPPPVFRPRTPESKRLPALPPSVPSSMQSQMPSLSSSDSVMSAGKKRRAPEDFDDCDNVPPQVFTTDSVPSREDAFTPRVRRALHTVRTGFTPTRHVVPPQASTTNSVHHSPRRATTGTPIIHDVTNSPGKGSSSQADKGNGKPRGWLGKIRGAGPGGHAPRSATMSSRPPVFHKPSGYDSGSGR
ncbi:hypothetical protein K474DRAFT_1768813 [Panus rudis PR-1116 ss-1]|nr:hypothetical protein K474DRAFT_1768813 [Panus rudis PR-1116 ss-1]